LLLWRRNGSKGPILDVYDDDDDDAGRKADRYELDVVKFM
jgi:hypothetical protein